MSSTRTKTFILRITVEKHFASPEVFARKLEDMELQVYSQFSQCPEPCNVLSVDVEGKNGWIKALGH